MSPNVSATAARLIWHSAGSPPPEGAIATTAPCWWCGMEAEGSGRRKADAIRDTFLDIGACPASDVVCAACAWTLSDRIALPAHLADAGIGKRLDAGGRLRVSVAGDDPKKPRLFLRLADGRIGVWNTGPKAAAEEPWTASIDALRVQPVDVGLCKLLAVVDACAISAGSTARFRNYHHLATPGRWLPCTAANRAEIRAWLLGPPVADWVAVLGDGQKHGAIYADGAVVRPGERPALWAWGSVVRYDPPALATQLGAWLALRQAGASDEEIASGRYVRAVEPIAFRFHEPAIRAARDEPSLMDVLAFLRQTPKEIVDASVPG